MKRLMFFLLVALASCSKKDFQAEAYQVPEGNYFYQIAEVDLDSSVTFSPVFTVRVGGESAGSAVITGAPEILAGGDHDNDHEHGCDRHHHHNCSLPVVWNYVKAINAGTYIDIRFSVAMESNLNYYEVLRSGDGKGYEVVGLIFPNGPGEYAYRDRP